MTLQERLLAARRAKQQSSQEGMGVQERLLAARKNRTAAPAPAPAEPEYEADWTDRAREVLGGLTFEFADEIGAGVAATAVKAGNLFGAEAGQGESWGDVYADMKDNLDAERRQYQDENTGEALALNLAGGLLTGGTGVAKAGGSQVFKNALKRAPKLANTARVAGVGATQGALYGAGAAERGETLEGVKQGAVTGAIAPVALQQAGRVLKKAASPLLNRNIATRLENTRGEFTPINLAAEDTNKLGLFYQKTIAPSFGGTKVREQSNKVFKQAQKKLDDAEEAASNAKLNASINADKGVRDTVKGAAIPANASREAVEALEQLDGQDAVQALNRMWQSGFRDAKTRNFDIDPEAITNKILGRLGGGIDKSTRDAVAASLKGEFTKGFTPNQVTRRVPIAGGAGMTREVVEDAKDGVMKGDFLMQTRNELASQATKLLGKGGQEEVLSRAMRTAAKAIDEEIIDALEGDAKKRFIQDLESYSARMLFEGATAGAVVNRQGVGSAEDILRAGKKYNSRSSAAGEATAQQAAQAAQRQAADEIAQAQAATDAPRALVESLKQRMPRERPDLWSQLVTTGALGGVPSLALGSLAAPATLPVGFGVGKLLSTPNMQKIIAGQSVSQRQARVLLDRLKKAGVPEETIVQINALIARNNVAEGEENE